MLWRLSITIIVVHESVVWRVTRITLLCVIRVRWRHSRVVLGPAVASTPSSWLAPVLIFIRRVWRPVVGVGGVIGGHGHVGAGRVRRHGRRICSHGVDGGRSLRQPAHDLATDLERKI